MQTLTINNHAIDIAMGTKDKAQQQVWAAFSFRIDLKLGFLDCSGTTSLEIFVTKKGVVSSRARVDGSL